MPNSSKERKLHVMQMYDIAKQDEILHPELLALKLDHRVSPLDIGLIAYSVRSKSSKQAKYIIDSSSVVPSRRKLIIALLDGYCVGAYSHKSVETDIKYLTYALDWCDGAGHSELYCSPEKARSAYMEYCNFLYQEVLKPGGMAPHTGQLLQGALRRSLQLQFPESSQNIISSVPPIKTVRDGLEPPEDYEVKRYIDISLSIAIRFSRFLMEGAKFPFLFQAPDYQSYIFPGNGKYVTPYTKGKAEYAAYDYDQGYILTLDELKALYPKTRIADLRIKQVNAERLMVEVNADPYHPFRMRLASLALRAYACVLNLAIGANSGEFVQFLVEGAIGLVKSPLKNELSAIKLRAKGLSVSYSVGRGPGVQLLREYLKFREWLLNGRECEYLFCKVRGAQYSLKQPTKLEDNFSSLFFKRIEGIFVPDGTRNIPPLLIRKYKSLTLHHLRHSPLLVGAVLNHTPSTNEQSYSGTTESNQKAEFGAYWASIKKAAERVRSQGGSEDTPTSVGHCDSMGNPEKDIPVVAIEPDCNSQYGCLFCVHYVVHCDETDVHKLLSFLYVIEGVRANSPTFEFSEETFKDVVVRIEFILSAISERTAESKNLVASLRDKVFNLGILTHFWEKRLQRYEQMGVYI